MHLGRSLALALVAPALGCTGAVSAPGAAGDAETARTTSAVVIVERSVDPSGASRVETSARFVRAAASFSMREALRAVGAAIDLPSAGTCAGISALAGGAGGAAQGSPAPVIDLVDVGAVTLETSGGETRLVPRQLPDVTDVVSGVVYARAAEPAVLPSSARYVLRVSGGPDVEAFEAAATAPADPSDVHFGGEDAAGVAVTAGNPVDVTWTSGGGDDAIYVEVQPAGFRCTLEDAPGVVGEAAHARLPASLIDEAGMLIVHRVHREGMSARGLEGGEMRFDFYRSVSYARR